MKRIIFILSCLFFAGNLSATEIIKVSELRPGMKGYGLSVFQGYTPERFEVELIDIVPRALPGTDLILVKCSGAGLEKSKIIAGMSGSPVYFEGKLAGAIAYAWGFSQDPIAGVTPIESMISATRTAGKTIAAIPFEKSEPAISGYDLKPVGAVIMVSGLSPALLPEAKSVLESFNLGPVMMGGGAVAGAEAPAILEPGSAVGVDLVSGDLSISAVGTATLVEGATVLAFGHGFFNAGAVSFPISIAKVHTVIASNAISFKFASSARELGELNLDTMTAISGKLGAKAKKIPVQVEVKNLATGINSSYQYQIANHPILGPRLVQLCLMESLEGGGAVSELAMVDLDLELKLLDYPEPIRYRDLFALVGRSFSFDYLAPLLIFSTNPYQKVKISELKFKLEIRPDWESAEIKSIWANKTEAAPGDTVMIGVRLRKFQGEEFEKQILFTVPENAQRAVNLRLMGGEQMPLDIAVPESVDDLIQAFKILPSPRWLVLQYQKPGFAIDYQGERLKSLPPSAQALLAGRADTQARPAPDFGYLFYETPYLIKGRAGIQLRIKTDTRR